MIAPNAPASNILPKLIKNFKVTEPFRFWLIFAINTPPITKELKAEAAKRMDTATQAILGRVVES